MLHGNIIERDELLLLISGDRAPKPESISLDEMKAGLNRGRSAMLWENAKQAVSGARPVLVVRDSELREFFSFVGTYINTNVPFSAFYRVISLSNFIDLFDDSVLPLYKMEKSKPRAHMVGLAIAEATLRRLDRSKKIESISVGEVRSTLASTLLSAAFSFGEDAPLSEISSRWTYLSDHISMEGDQAISRDVASIISKITAPLNRSGKDKSYINSDTMSHVIKDVTREGMISKYHWAAICDRTPQLISAYQKLRGPREERVKALFATMADVQKIAHDNKEYAACIAGSMFALVGDGSFQYLPLALDFSNDPQTIMWFAGWSSLMSKTDALSIGKSLGARSARDIFVYDDIYTQQKSDISFDEIIIDGLEFSKNGRSSNEGTILVEIYPTISSYFRVNPSFINNSLNIDESSIRAIEEAQIYIDRARVSLGRAFEGRSRSKQRSRLRD